MPKIDKNGKTRTTEEDMIVPALKIIRENPGCTMSTIKLEISRKMKFYPDDLALSVKRPGERMYHQIIGNLICHRKNNKFGKYVDVITVEKNKSKFTLNDEGEKFLDSLLEKELEEQLNDYFDMLNVNNAIEYPVNVNLEIINNRKPELCEGFNNQKYKTDYRLSKTVLKRQNFQCLYSSLLGIKHETFTSSSNHPCIFPFHIIPMKAQNDFVANLDREENIVGLCSACYSILHFGSFQEKEKILKSIYESRRQALASCNIIISFEELLNKYYQ